ncbi:tape measure protein [Alphaproteobacteria bacterium]|nr:tape measure protein [Alphaproteobacteria bacterium]
MAVEIQVVANTKQAEKSMEKLEKKVDKVGKSADKTAGGFDNVSKSVKNVSRNDKLGDLEKNTKRAADSAEQLDKNFSSATSTINTFAKRATIALTGFLAVRGTIAGIGDEFKNINSQIRLVTKSSTEALSVNRSLLKVTRETRSSLQSTTTLFSRFARANKDIGATQQQLIKVTKAVQQAGKISGGSADTLNASIIQLSQGLSSGVLRGEELNSVLEGNSRLAQAIADGLGIGIGQLRELGAEGKLTSRAVFGAILQQVEKINGEFQQVEATFGDVSATAFLNFKIVINQIDKAIGLSKLFIGSVKAIGDAFKALSEVLDSVLLTLRVKFNSLALRVEILFSRITSVVKGTNLGKDIADAFKSVQNLDLSNIKLPTIKLDSVVEGFSSAISEIDRFYDKVVAKFQALYMKIIGNSIWRDTIDEIGLKAKDLNSIVVPTIEKYANKVISIFKNVEKESDITLSPEVIAARKANEDIAQSGGSNLPFVLRAFQSSMSILEGALSITSTALQGLQSAIGDANFTGLVAGIILLNKNLRSAVTSSGLSNIGRGTADFLATPGLERRQTNLGGEVAALERIAGISSGKVKNVNESLTNLAERSGPEATKEIRAFEKNLRNVKKNTPAATVRDLQNKIDTFRGSLSQTAVKALEAELALRKRGVSQEAAARKANKTTLKLGITEERLRKIRENSVNAFARLGESFRGFTSSVGAIAGGAAGFTIGQNIVTVLEDRVGKLSGWSEGAITFGSSLLGQGIGAALGQGIAVILTTSAPVVGRLIGLAIPKAIAMAIGTATAAIAAAIVSPELIEKMAKVLGFSDETSKVISDFLNPPWLQDFRTTVKDFGGSIADMVQSFKNSRLGKLFGLGAQEPIRRANGGPVSGPGTSKSDSIPAMLSNGEFVVNAAATKKHAGLLARLNGGMNPGGDGKGGYAGGGLVGDEAAVLKHLRKFEGYVPHIYTDTEGFATIGIGHLLTDNDIKSGRFFDPNDPLTENYKKMSKKELGQLFHANGLGSQYRKPSVTLNDGEANSMALADYGRNLGHLLSKDVFREAYAKAPFYAQGVLGDLAFNLGSNLDKSFPGFTRGMAAGDYPHAAGQLRDSRYYYQTGRRAIANVNQLGQGTVDPVGLKSQSRVSNLFGYALNNGYSRNLMKALALDENQGGLFQASNPGNLISDVLGKTLSSSSRLALETAGYMKPKAKEEKKPEEKGFFSRLGSFFADTNLMMSPMMGFANGGNVSGPGTGRSDSIMARLSNGEFVVNAKDAEKNRTLLEMINSGNLPGFKDGTPNRGAVGTQGQLFRELAGRHQEISLDDTDLTKINEEQFKVMNHELAMLEETKENIRLATEHDGEARARDLIVQQQILSSLKGKTTPGKEGTGVDASPKSGFGHFSEGLAGAAEGAAGAAGIKTDEVSAKFKKMYDDINEADENSKMSRMDSAKMVAGGFGTLLGEQAKYSESAFKASQGLAIAQATMDGAKAVQNAFANVPFPLNIAAAGVMAAQTAAQVSAIKSQKFQKPSFATGGYVSGPGTGTSDSISANLSNGEFVMNQKATAANRQTLEAMNSGQSVQQGGGYIANQTVQVEVGLGRNSQATADAAGSSVINAINQGNADGRMSRRRAR